MIKNVYIFDENIYYMHIKNGLDVQLLEDIETNHKVIVTPKIASKVIDNISNFTHDSKTIIRWKAKIMDLEEKTSSLIKYCIREKIFGVEIYENDNQIEKIFSKFDPSLAPEDLELIRFAYYLKDYNFNVIIVSEDSDLLYSANLLLSFYGYSIRILSIYELLRTVRNQIFLRDYMKHFKYQFNFHNISINDGQFFDKDTVLHILQHGLLTLHTKPDRKVKRLFNKK